MAGQGNQQYHLQAGMQGVGGASNRQNMAMDQQKVNLSYMGFLLVRSIKYGLIEDRTDSSSSASGSKRLESTPC